MRSSALLFWMVFYLLLVLRLSHYSASTPLQPTFRNSETLFQQYPRQHFQEAVFVPHSLKNFPSLLALFEAVWRGDLNFFPKEVRDFYLHSGTLAVLALSAQHIWVLATVFKVFANGFLLLLYWVSPTAYWKGRATLFRFSKDALFLFCSVLLVFTSGTNPSALRAALLYGAFFFVQKFSLSNSKTQALFSSAALLLFFEPAWAFQTGFVLSFIGVFFLFLEKGRVWPYLIPILFMPFLFYYFGKVSVVSIFLSPLVAWIWNFFWIPLGFLLPLLFHSVGEAFILPFLEKGAVFFFGLHNWCAAIAQRSVVRGIVLRWEEVILLELWILGGALYLVRRLKESCETSSPIH